MLKRAVTYSLWALALAASGAAAQNAPDTQDTDKTSDRSPVQLDEVVVTARRRDEVLQDVPLSVTALDAIELQSRGIDDLSGLGAAVPNLVVYPARAYNNAIVAYIRGVGQFDPVWGFEPGVGVYVDDVYLTRPQASLLEILDVERIEVLRGPQGTLYGKNTIGGAIKYVTRKVDNKFSGNVGITLGNYDRRDLKAVVNVPMGERSGTRVAFGSLERDGFGKNLITGEGVSAKDVTLARVTTDWWPSDYVDLRFSYDRYRDRSGARGSKRLLVNPFDPAHTPPLVSNFDVLSGMPNVDEMDAETFSATVDWELSERWRLKSVTAHHDGDTNGNVDFDALPQPISDLDRRLFDEQTSQEFQLHANSRRAHAIAGLYFLDGEAGGTVRQAQQNIFGEQFFVSHGAVETRSAAIYGDLNWDINARLSLEAGLRYTSEKKTGTVLNQGYTDATFATPNGEVSADFTDSETFDSLSPRINLSYEFTQDAMLYAQASRGFKSGSYNIRADTVLVPESAFPYEDETVTSYEIGAKSQLLGEQLTLNAAVFHNDYQDIQLSVFTGYDTDGDGIDDDYTGDFKSAGAGTINGVELEARAHTGLYLTWLGHVGYLDSQYDEFISRGVDIADSQHFPNAPRWTSGMSAIADIPMGASGSLLARVDGHYQSKVYPTTELVPASAEVMAQAGYSLWNASLTWRSPMEKWQVALLGQNLTDKEYRTTGFNLPFIGVRNAYYGPPRTVSLSVAYFF